MRAKSAHSDHQIINAHVTAPQANQPPGAAPVAAATGATPAALPKGLAPASAAPTGTARAVDHVTPAAFTADDGATAVGAVAVAAAGMGLIPNVEVEKTS